MQWQHHNHFTPKSNNLKTLSPNSEGNWKKELEEPTYRAFDKLAVPIEQLCDNMSYDCVILTLDYN